MDLRTRTALFCAALALAIATSVLLRSRVRRTQGLFAAFAATVGLWFLAQALYGFYGNILWERATELLAVLVPQLAVRLFTAIVPRTPAEIFPPGASIPPPASTTRAPPAQTLVRVASVLAVPMVALALSPYHAHDAARVALFVYVGSLIVAALWQLASLGSASQSRAVKARTRFLAVIGALATAFQLADFLWWIGARLPPVGAVLSIVFLFVLSQSLESARLLDLYDLAGRLLVATALAFCLAGIFYLFVSWVGRFNTMYLNAVLASIAILVLFNPLQAKVEEKIHQIFFRERFDLETAVTDLRRRLAHVLETRDMAAIVLAGLERSRRATGAALYLRDAVSVDPGGAAYLLEGHFGEAPSAGRIEEVSSRALLDRLTARGTVVSEEVERELTEALDAGDAHAASAARDLYGRLDEVGGGAAFALKLDDGELVGIFVVADERVRDAFSPEEIALLEGLAAQLASVVENSRAYARVKERDRLAALGAMAAGLAHEVKNPLGAIKGAAQLLAEGPSARASAPVDHADQEFVGIILEEVDRLDRVVTSILDYARPRTGEVDPTDVNATVRRTMQILSPSHDDQIDVSVDLADGLPQVRIDPEQLRQVLINLVNNAVQAMGGRGRLSVTTAYRRSVRATWAIPLEHGAVEIRVADTGPGISNKVLKNLFVPFFTTKTKGTGLGLAISQRIVQNAGGAIDVQTAAGVGTTFTILLPATAKQDAGEEASPSAHERVDPASTPTEATAPVVEPRPSSAE
jgi:two-component system sensor histidine kinase HydH